MEPKDSPTLKKNKDNNKTMAKTFKKILKPGEKKKKQKQVVISSVKILVNYLENNCVELEGICRISGNSTKVKELKKQLENGEQDIDFSKMDQHVVSGTLKSFIRDYNSEEPLLTFDLYKNFLASVDIKERNAKISFIKSLLSALPKENYDLLQILLKFLFTIQLHSNKNKMTSSNLAIVFSPTLLRPREESLETMMTDSNTISGIVKILIEEFNALYEIKSQTILYQVSAQEMGIKEDKRSTSEQLEDAKVSIEQLTKHLAEEARERAILETYITSIEQKISELQDVNKSLNEEKDSLSDLLNEFKDTNKNQAKEIEQLKENQIKIEKENKELNNNNINLEKNIELLKSNIESLKLNIDKLNSNVKSASNEVEKLKQLNKEKEMENDRLRVLNKEKDTDNERLRQSIKEKDSSNDQLKQQTIQLTKERDDSNMEVSRAQTEISLLLSTSNDKSSKKNSLKNQKKDLDQALKRCKDQESKINQLEKEKLKLNEEIIKLQKQSSSSSSASTSSSATTTSTSTSNHKFVFGKKPSQKQQPATTVPTTPPPPPLDEDDLLSVKKFAFHYMNLYIKTDSVMRGLPCNINSTEILEEILDKKLKVNQWSDFISKKLKE